MYGSRIIKDVNGIFKDYGYYMYSIEFPLQGFYQFIKLTDELIKNDISKAIQEYHDFLKNADEYDSATYDHQDHEVKIQIKTIYYQSLLLSLYSILEKSLNDLCTIAEGTTQILITKYTNKRDSGITKSKKYLENGLNISFEEVSNEWDHISNISALRNQIAHNHSCIIIKKINLLKYKK